MHKYRGRIQSEVLEHIRPLIKVYHHEEQLVRVNLWVSVRVGHDLVLIVSMAAHLTLSRRLKGRKHHDDRIITRRTFHVILKFLPIEPQNWLLHVHVQHRLHLLGEGLTNFWRKRLSTSFHDVELLRRPSTYSFSFLTLRTHKNSGQNQSENQQFLVELHFGILIAELFDNPLNSAKKKSSSVLFIDPEKD